MTLRQENEEINIIHIFLIFPVVDHVEKREDYFIHGILKERKVVSYTEASSHAQLAFLFIMCLSNVVLL